MMKLATARFDGRTAAVRVDGDEAVELPAADVGALLAQPDWRHVAAQGGTRHQLSGLDLAPVVPQPGKIVCVGLNYRNHILEMGRELPEHPTLFAKYAEALIGPNDEIVKPADSDALDWEGELAVVIGTRVRNADAEAAAAAIAGYAVLNDVTVRDYQYRTKQWLQGKTFEDTTPFGPHLVTTDGFELSRVDLEQRREGDVLGRSQSGYRSSLENLRVLRDEDTILAARRAAEALLDDDETLAGHPLLAESVLVLEASRESDFMEKS